jgi:hypothetical protein
MKVKMSEEGVKKDLICSCHFDFMFYNYTDIILKQKNPHQTKSNGDSQSQILSLQQIQQILPIPTLHKRLGDGL